MTYILIFIGFLVVVFLLQKFNQGQMKQGQQAMTQANNPLRKLSSDLGLQFEEMTSETGKKVLSSSGSHVWGEYKEIPVEMIYKSNVQKGTGINIYSYSMEKTITFTVKNSAQKSFSILPKTLGAEGGKPTGHSVFDEHLLLLGDISLPSDIAEYFGRLGWMHLTLQGTKLIFHDTFYEQFQGVTGGVQMMSAVHPIWKSTVTVWDIDAGAAKEFFDTLVALIKRINVD